MHGVLFNEMRLNLRLRPKTPLLVKAGGDASIFEPVMAYMQFVRTRRNGSEEPFIPGSSLRGPLRSHAEKLVRTVLSSEACAAVSSGSKTASGLRRSCGSADKVNDPAQVYRQSCYVCRLFGNTRLASRVRFSDLFASPDAPVLLETRFGVAIDRVTGAVGVGPFDLEVASDGEFVGSVTLRNFTLGQLGLLGAALLDLQDGLVALGYGKKRGLGRVRLTFSGRVRQLGPQARKLDPDVLAGIDTLAGPRPRQRYFPDSSPRASVLNVPFRFEERGLYREAGLDHEAVTALLSEAAPLWVEEVERVER